MPGRTSLPSGSSGIKTPLPRISAEKSPLLRKTLFVTGLPVEGGLVTPCGLVASCCCSRPLLKRRTLPLVKLLFGKERLSVHSCSVGLLGSGFDGDGAGFARVATTSAGVMPCDFGPKLKAEVKTTRGLFFYLLKSRKSAGVMPLYLPPVTLPPVWGVPCGLKLRPVSSPGPI